MNLLKKTVMFSSIVLTISCGTNSKKKSISEKVDHVVLQLEKKINTYKKIATLDHHRMAAETGVYTPVAIATIFSKPEIDIALVKENQLIGLDLPFKVLCYSEPDTLNVSIAYTTADFIQKRHNINSDFLKKYDSVIENIIATFPKEMISTNPTDVPYGFGIINIKSDFDFESTVGRLKKIVMQQGDTKWFSDIDYKKEAINMNLNLKPTTLLLFGGPAPGGKAMETSPKIGLDAFCQKLLVYEKDNGEVWIAYNDIEAFASLYYQTSTKPQQMINQRLKMTFTKIVTAK